MQDQCIDIMNILATRCPFFGPQFDPVSDDIYRYLRECRILVVGAGGLGCEILKCLSVSGFRVISVIDMDTIDVSNLNRQFLFRDRDVGRSKAEVAAERINERFEHLGVSVRAKVARIQDLEDGFYAGFDIVIAGLDNIPARRWLNSVLASFIKHDSEGNVDPSSIRFLLDGGTEGFKGQARVIIPTVTACFECTLDTFPPVATYPLCTIAQTPRLPEHCIEYALTVLFEQSFPEKTFNSDDQKDLDWLFDASVARATAFNIGGVTKQMTKGVAKRIIPAVASTNALIAAALVNEAFKIATYANPVMSNYFMYMGQTGINTQTIAYEKKDDCVVCGNISAAVPLIEVRQQDTLLTLIEKLGEDKQLRLTKPSLVNAATGRVIFMQHPPALREQLEHRLTLSIDTLVSTGDFSETLIVTDPSLRNHISVKLRIT